MRENTSRCSVVGARTRPSGTARSASVVPDPFPVEFGQLIRQKPAVDSALDDASLRSSELELMRVGQPAGKLPLYLLVTIFNGGRASALDGAVDCLEAKALFGLARSFHLKTDI